MSTADRKKKNFSFSRKFPFMKSKDQIGSDEQLSTEERKLHIFTARKRSLRRLCFYRCLSVHMGGGRA